MEKKHYSLPTGTLIKGPELTYKIVKILGRGGFGITYLVTSSIRIGNVDHNVKFALKEHFISDLCSRDGQTSRVEYSAPVAETVKGSMRAFIKEAQRVKALGIEHPNIVRINEVFEANNTAYYVMEYLGDVSLEDYIKQNGPLSLSQANEIMLPIVSAVKELHANKIAHYDIKPANIMLCYDEDNRARPVLIDFGLAKHYDHKGNATSTIAAAGVSRGYAPIEQYAGISSFSPSSDVYALAATYYFVLTGKHPAEPLNLNHDELYNELSRVAPSLTDAIFKGMALQAKDRYADAGQFENAMLNGNDERSFGQKTVISRDETDDSKTRLLPIKKKNPVKPYLIAFGCLIAGIVLIVALQNNSDSQQSVETDSVISGDTAVAVAESVAIEPEDQVNARTECKNLDLCVMRGNNYYFFSEFEWRSLPDEEKKLYSKQGIILIGNGQRFMASLNVSREMDWLEARSEYGNLLPTFEQGKVFVSNGYALDKAIETYGGDAPVQDGDNYWTSKGIPAKDGESYGEAWYACMWEEEMYKRPVNDGEFVRVRTVTAIPGGK